MDIQQTKKTYEGSNPRAGTQQLQPGLILMERYLIQGVIGVGGMGAVYRARDMHFPNVVKLVAVKEMMNLASDRAVRQTIVRNFEREANLLATLDHRAIPRIYDYFTINERCYLVLEFVVGSNLESMIDGGNGPVSEARAIVWAIELCDVLSYLHNHKPEAIIFRDIKPSNVMVNPSDHIVLVDFGIARTFQVGQRGTMIGTEGYSPPEQYRGEASPTADIYALGATLHHLLTGRDPRLEPPFSFDERPVRKFNPGISAELEDIINTALQYNAADRFQSAEEMRASLVAAAQKFGGASVGVVWQSAKPEEGPEPTWTFTCEDEIRGSPNCVGSTVYIGSYDNNLYALNANNGNFLWKYPTEGGIVSKPAIQENNVYFGSEDRGLYVVYANTGRVNWTYYTKAPIRSSPFLAEGHVFFGSDDTQLHAVNAITGRRAWAADAGSPVRSTPLVFQDAVYFGTENGDFFCLDFSGSVRWRFNARRPITASPCAQKGVVYFTSLDATLYALDARSGWAIWKYRLGKGSISSPVIAENLLFTGAVDGVITCVDINTAKEVWSFATGHQVTGSPLVHQDSLYCGSVDGYLYCLEYRSGRLRWKFKTGGPITGTPVALNNMVYVGSTDHKLYALPVG